MVVANLDPLSNARACGNGRARAYGKDIVRTRRSHVCETSGNVSPIFASIDRPTKQIVIFANPANFSFTAVNHFQASGNFLPVPAASARFLVVKDIVVLVGSHTYPLPEGET